MARKWHTRNVSWSARFRRWLIRWTASFLIAIALWAYWLPVKTGDQPAGLNTAKVTYVFDGDTIAVSLGGEKETRVRLLGINAPEIAHAQDGSAAEPYGDEAAAALKALLEGQDVALEYDEETHDRYGRTLAYLWVDGILINETLLETGCARVMILKPNVRYRDRLNEAERRAKAARAGLWALR